MNYYNIMFDVLSLPKVQKCIKIMSYNVPYLGNILKIYDVLF